VAFSVYDARRGTWSIRWNNGTRIESETITRNPPQGWRPGTPKPKEPAIVVEVKAAKNRLEKSIRVEKQRGGAAMSVRDFLEHREQFCSARGAKGSRKVFRRVFNLFAEWCELRQIHFAEKVNARHCNEWVNERASRTEGGKQRAKTSIARDMALLAAAWNYGVKLGLVSSNPWIHIEPAGTEIEKQKGSWSPEELEKLIANSKQWMKDILIVGCNTGIRISALLQLRWKDVAFSLPGKPGFGTVAVRKELDKAGKGYVVPMSERCYGVFRRLADSRPKDAPLEDIVLRSFQGKPIRFSTTTSESIQRACTRVGLPKPDSPNHHMRRTFGRQAVLGQLTGRPVPIYVVSRWLGHSSVKMTEHYLDLKIDASHHWMEQAREGDSSQ